VNQLLVGSVEIDPEFDSENHGSIPHNSDREEVGTTWYQNWLLYQIQLVVK
jgi:hypothetical protein